jgi:hypothetical protein
VTSGNDAARLFAPRKHIAAVGTHRARSAQLADDVRLFNSGATANVTAIFTRAGEDGWVTSPR